MKITNIEKVKDSYSKYELTFEPNWLEKLLGVKSRKEMYKQSNYEYTFGGGWAYLDEEGNFTKNGSYIGESIDKWKRKQNW